MPTPAYANSLKARTEDFGPQHQKITDEVASTGKQKDPPTVPPHHIYGWRHYYVKPKWKDFEPSAGLADRLDSAPPPPPRRFKHDTPGQVMLALLHEAHARGALLTIHADFTEQKDSAGRHWHHGDKDPNKRRGFVSGTINHKFDPGTTLLQVAQWMAEEGFAEARMRHRTLQLFLPKKGDDLSKTVVLSKGRNLVDGPKSSTTRDLVTDVYVLSESGVHGWVGDHSARKRWGRIEAIQNLNSVRTWEEAADRGQRHLDQMKDPRASYTYGVVPDAGANPYKDYGIGDYITVVDSNGKPVKHRVRQIGLNWSEDQVSIAATLSDVLLSEKAKHHRRHRTHSGKSSSTTTARTVISDDKTLSDDFSPNPPSAPRITSKAGTVKVAWDGKDETGDPPVWDQSFVEVHVGTAADFEPDETTFTERLHAAGSSVFNDLPYDEPRYFKFVAVDEGGDRSGPSEEINSIMAQVSNNDLGSGAVGVGELGDDVPLGTDGLAPASSPDPTVVGVPRLLIVKWTGLANPDPVRYEIHISVTDGFTPDTTTFLHTTSATIISIESLPDGTPLQYGVQYFVKIKAYDDDGVGPASIQATGQLDPAGSADIAVGSITADKLEAVLILAGTIATAASGRRVELSNESGITVWESNGDALVSFPTDPLSPMFLNGDVVAKSLTILDNMSVQGVNNVITKGSVLTMDSNIAASKSSPTAVTSWDSVDLDNMDLIHMDFQSGLYWDSSTTSFFSMNSLYDWVEKRATNGTRTATYTVETAGGLGDFFYPVGGITKVGSFFYILGRYMYAPAASRGWYVTKWNTSFVYQSQWAWLDGNQPTEDYNLPAIGNNGTNLLIAQCGANDGRVKVREYAPGSNTMLNNFQSATTFDPDVGVAGVQYGSFDFGSNRYIVAPQQNTTDNVVWAFTESGGVLTPADDDHFPRAENGRIIGLAWDGTNFWSSSISQAKWYKYTNIKWGGATSSKWWISYTWEDTDATGGTHETDQSPRRSVTATKRAKMVVTTASIPDMGGTDDPDSVNIYIGRGSSDPGRTAMWLNASPASGIITANITSLVTSAVANPPAANNFPGGTPGSFKSTATRATSGIPQTNLQGDGTGNFDAIVPVGCMMMWPGVTAPTGWLFVIGQSLLRATYPDLATFCLAEGWGSADGTHFYLPDMRGRAPYGVGTNVAIRGSDGHGETLRGPNHTHSVTNHGGHAHNISSVGHTGASNVPGGGSNDRLNAIGGSGPGGSHDHTGSTGSGGSHDHGGNTGNSAADPIGYLGVNFIIKT